METLPATVHPTIAREMSLLDRSVEMAETAFDAISTGAAEAKACNVMLGAGRVLQGAARQRLTQRLAAGRLVLQETKLIEAANGQRAIAQQKAA